MSNNIAKDWCIFDKKMDACFVAFDKDGDGLLSIDEFEFICRALFRNDRGKIYGVEEPQLKEIFDTFDLNGDGFINPKEFEVSFSFFLNKRILNFYFLSKYSKKSFYFYFDIDKFLSSNFISLFELKLIFIF